MRSVCDVLLDGASCAAPPPYHGVITAYRLCQECRACEAQLELMVYKGSVFPSAHPPPNSHTLSFTLTTNH